MNLTTQPIHLQAIANLTVSRRVILSAQSFTKYFFSGSSFLSEWDDNLTQRSTTLYT